MTSKATCCTSILGVRRFGVNTPSSGIKSNGCKRAAGEFKGEPHPTPLTQQHSCFYSLPWQNADKFLGPIIYSYTWICWKFDILIACSIRAASFCNDSRHTKKFKKTPKVFDWLSCYDASFANKLRWKNISKAQKCPYRPNENNGLAFSQVKHKSCVQPDRPSLSQPTLYQKCQTFLFWLFLQWEERSNDQPKSRKFLAFQRRRNDRLLLVSVKTDEICGWFPARLSIE